MPDLNQFLVSLLVRLGIMAAIASVLARTSRFKSMLMLESRTLNQRLALSFWLSSVFAASVATRQGGRNYQAADLGLEGSLLAGLLLVCIQARKLVPNGGNQEKHHTAQEQIDERNEGDLRVDRLFAAVTATYTDATHVEPR